MAETDVFSALNVGSGLNTSELIKNLVDAERAEKWAIEVYGPRVNYDFY